MKIFEIIERLREIEKEYGSNVEVVFESNRHRYSNNEIRYVNDEAVVPMIKIS